MVITTYLPMDVAAVNAPAPYDNAIRADLGLAVICLGYERMVNRMFAFELGLGAFGTWFGPTFGDPNFTGFGGELRPTFFPMENGPEGLYVAPFFRLDWITASSNGTSGNNLGFSAGTFVGYSHMFTAHINGRFGAGLQWMNYAVQAGDTRLDFHQIFPALDLDLGWGL